MQESIYGIYGASGFGSEVMPIAREQLLSITSLKNSLYFIDDNIKKNNINGIEVVTYNDFLQIPSKHKYISIAIADSNTREILTQKIIADNIKLWDLISKHSVIMDNVDFSPGVIIAPFVTITSNIKIGKSFHANLYSYIGHDCIVGDYVTLAPNVSCNGNVIIDDHVYIATGAIIKQGKQGQPLTIGKNAIIGMGAVVTKNIPDGITVIGNPAIPLSKKALKAQRRKCN